MSISDKSTLYGDMLSVTSLMNQPNQNVITMSNYTLYTLYSTLLYHISVRQLLSIHISCTWENKLSWNIFPWPKYSHMSTCTNNTPFLLWHPMCPLCHAKFHVPFAMMIYRSYISWQTSIPFCYDKLLVYLAMLFRRSILLWTTSSAF